MRNATNKPLLPHAPLTQTDFARLAESCIPSELATAADLYRVDTHDGAELVGRKPKAGTDYAGIVFPYRWPGEETIRVRRLRRDHPDLIQQSDGSVKEAAKYMSAPGAPNCFYFPPQVTTAMFADAAIPAGFYEGEKKTLAAARFFEQRGEKVLLIGLSGVSNWRGKVGVTVNGAGKRQSVPGVIADFDKIEWEGRAVEIVFDADSQTNPQVSKARRGLANELIRRGAVVKILEMPAAAATGAKGIDDLLRVQGVDYVAEWFAKARAASLPVGQRTKVQGVTFEVKDEGVYALEDYGDGVPRPVFVCSPLRIISDTCDEDGRNYGRLLRFLTPRGEWREWAMPMSLLKGDGQEYRGELLDQGVTLGGRKARELLATYLNQKPERQATSVGRMGWHAGAFVLPQTVFGAPDGEEIYLQTLQRNWLIRQAGTLEEWRAEVAALCVGNSRLAFAVSVGFAAPLLGLVGGESGGFHIRGGSSKGKSTAQYVGGSVWGGGEKGYLLRWRATANGLESVAEMHNDGLLCLDEIKELDPREAGEVAYMLGNGQGKLRMEKRIALRRPLEWRLLYLSSGELSLAEHVEKAGKRLYGGQEVRLVDIEADAGKGFGLFEDLHSFKGGNALSEHLRMVTSRYYGTAMPAFLAKLVAEKETVKTQYRNFAEAFRKDTLKHDSTFEASRVANRFALVAFAGKLASEYGITGWIEPEAENAAALLFADWLERKGQRPTDDQLIVRQIRHFIEAQSARFRLIGAGIKPDERPIYEQAGYVEKGEQDGATYYFSQEVFRKTVCAGLDATHAAKVLQQRGWLIANHGYQYKRRDPETGQPNTPFYAVSSEILAS